MAALSRSRWAGVRVRTTAVAVLAVGVAVLLASAALLALLRSDLQRNVDAVLTQQAQTLEGALQVEPIATVRLTARLGDSNVEQLIGPDGAVLAASPEIAGEGALVTQLPPSGARQVRTARLGLDPDAHYRLLALGTRDSSGRPVTIVVAQNLDIAERSARLTGRLLAIIGPLLLLVVAATTYLMTGRALQPVGAMRRQVQAIDAQSLDERVSLPIARDEVWELARTLNVMLTRLEASALAQQQFVSDASHELRSPLAAIRTTVEVAVAHPESGDWQSVAAIVLEECGRVEQLVTDLLLLATSDERGVALRSVEVDLEEVVAGEVDRVRRERSVQVSVHGEPVRMSGDAARLRRLVHNVVDNAGRHARSSVTVSLVRRDNQAVIDVQDDGPGIAPEDRERVFERFVRLDSSRSRSWGGSGLGLAIARQLVEAHGGSIAFVDADTGACCRIVLPVA
ncbi:MAG: ATP-binding region, ATPase domain protein [Frankiales bacterium]|nr:ATP-binding region, ATPase domain protein [Frankiales bacterium]